MHVHGEVARSHTTEHYLSSGEIARDQSGRVAAATLFYCSKDMYL